MSATAMLPTFTCSFSNVISSTNNYGSSITARRLSSLTAFGRMDEALSVFESTPAKTKRKDTLLWNLMIRGYVDCGLYDHTLQMFNRMLADGVRCDHFTFPFVIKSCGAMDYVTGGLKIHAKVLKKGLDCDLFISNSLISMYFKLGLVKYAEAVFDEMPWIDSVSWNTMIDGYASNMDYQKSLLCFCHMQKGFGWRPDEVALIGALEACSSEMLVKNGNEIHCYAIRHGFDKQIKVQTTILDMYSKCDKVMYAERLFKMMYIRNAVAWNVMIRGYVLNNQAEDAFSWLRKMQADRNDPDVITMVNLLPACVQLRNPDSGKAIHGMCIRKGLIPRIVLQTALIDMYAKCGMMKNAELLFDRMEERTIVSWNTMITGYVQNSRNIEGIQLFIELIKENIEPDAFTISSTVPAYAELAFLQNGRQIHGYVMKLGYGLDTFILNSVLYMYARCGDIQASRTVFDKMASKSIVSWNSMMMGYAIHGHGKSALDLFSKMHGNDMQANESTFSSVLSACSISGLVDDGWEQFNFMTQKYDIAPKVEHYACMVDLLGRKGDLKKALDFIEKMPLTPTTAIWGSLLTASRNNNNIELAEYASEHIFNLDNDNNNTGCYVLLSKMYADAGRWDDVRRIKCLMKEDGVRKTEARSMVELNGKSYTFGNGDKSHVKSATIHEVSDILSRCIREFKEKGGNLRNKHSVRLGVCYGLISSTVGAPIMIKKNIRVCDDCHLALKLISKFTGREIIVGDLRLYHHFSSGLCSCGDYW